MIDMRKPKERRRGEIHGPFCWGTVLNAFVMIVITLAIGYTCFMIGRHYETVMQKQTVDQTAIYKEYKAYRVGSH